VLELVDQSRRYGEIVALGGPLAAEGPSVLDERADRAARDRLPARVSAIDDPDGILAIAASLFPLFSPIVMALRVALGEASAAEIVTSLLLLAASIAMLVPLGARIYERSVLRMGKSMKLREAWRAARA
jgi:hypothetical protein